MREREIEALARIHHNHPLRHARILLADAVDIDPNSYLDTDMEVSLVHELLHLRFLDATNGSLKDASPEWRGMEAAVEATAQALVAINNEREARG